jgi:membrane-bound lytic murein transglycosylase B
MVPLEAARRIDTELPRRDGSCQATRDMSVPLALSDWRSRGVRATGGRPLPSSQMNASMVAGTTRRFLVYRNYDALLDYNCANAYALGVALLADRISSGTPAPAVARPKGRALRPKK